VRARDPGSRSAVSCMMKPVTSASPVFLVVVVNNQSAPS